MIMLDSGANKNVIVNPDLLDGIRIMDKVINVSGIGGTLDIQAVGHLPGIGEVYFADHSVVPGNILSFADVLDRANVHVTTELITAWFHDGSRVEFKHIGKLYFADARAWFPDKWKNRNISIMVTTVKTRIHSQRTQGSRERRAIYRTPWVPIGASCSGEPAVVQQC